MTPFASKSFDVIFNNSAASGAREESFQRIVAKPSGDKMLYMVFSSIQTRSATAKASAPPEPPSPFMMAITGTFRSLISSRFLAIASP